MMRLYTVSGASTTQYLVTDADGRFTATLPVAEPFSVVAHAQVWTPLCEWENVESGEVTTSLFFDGAVTYSGQHIYVLSRLTAYQELAIC